MRHMFEFPTSVYLYRFQCDSWHILVRNKKDTICEACVSLTFVSINMIPNTNEANARTNWPHVV